MVENNTFDLLIEEATPDLYDRNAFRILGLPIDSSYREIKRHVEKLRMKDKFSIGADEEESIDEKRNEGKSLIDLERVREAVHRLNDPELRFVDEFFWYWPLELNGSKQDDAIQAVLNDDINLAVRIWKSSKNSQSEKHIAVHNLAVYYHHIALKSITKANIIIETKEKRRQIWDKAFSYWKYLLEFEIFWSRVSERIKDFDDPRLTHNLSQKIRNILPTALLLINSRLTVSYILKGENPRANIARYHLRKSGFEDSIQLEAKKIALEPIRNNIKTITNSAIREAEGDLIHANEHLLELISGETLKRYLTAVDILLPIDNPIRVGIHDEVAEKISSCVRSFGRKTELWKEARNVIERAYQIPESMEQKREYEEAINGYKERERDSFTWRTKGYYDLNKVLLEELEEAYKLFNLEKFDQAIGKIYKLFSSHPNLIGKTEELIIYKPLALCLRIRALKRLEESLIKQKEPPPTLAKVNLFLKYPLFDDPFLNTRKNCIVCGKQLWGRYFKFHIKGRDVQLCESCGKKANSELETRRRNTQNIVRQSAGDLLLAEKLDPENETIKSHVKNVRQIAKNVEIRMPSPPGIPRGKRDRLTDSRTRKEKRKSSDKKSIENEVSGYNWPVIVFFILFVLVISIGVPWLGATLERGKTSTRGTNQSLVTNVTDTPKSTNTPKPIPTPVPTYNPYQLPYRESFDSTTVDWYTGNNAIGNIKIDEGMYVISVPKDEGISGTNGAVFTNAKINIHAHYISGQDHARSGLNICFRCSDESGYELTIFGDGAYGVFKYENDEISKIIPIDYHVDVNNYWHQPNMIKIVMNYSEFEIYCNGSKIAEFIDTSFESGSIYLGGFASPTNGVVVSFDNLLVTE